MAGAMEEEKTVSVECFECVRAFVMSADVGMQCLRMNP